MDQQGHYPRPAPSPDDRVTCGGCGASLDLDSFSVILHADRRLAEGWGYVVAFCAPLCLHRWVRALAYPQYHECPACGGDGWMRAEAAAAFKIHAELLEELDL